MKKIALVLCLIFCITLISGCQNNTTINNKTVIEEDTMEDIKITINNEKFSVTLEDNEVAEELVKMLPLELSMSELNGNEKYVYMDKTFNTNSFKPKHIETGDIMLYGDDCLVIFYKSFDTNYSYTKIGHIDNLPDLGDGNITVKFEK